MRLFKKPGYANEGLRHQSGIEKEINILFRRHITSATEEVEKGAILKIISNGVLMELWKYDF